MLHDSPLPLIRQNHIDTWGWSGVCIKAFRITWSMSRQVLASKLHMRSSKLATYEDDKRPLGIKLAKQLAEIFEVDWHLFRSQPKDVKIYTKEEYDVYEDQKRTERKQAEGKIKRVKRGIGGSN